MRKMRRMKKSTSRLIAVIAIALVAFAGIALVGNLGMQALNPANWEFRSVNEDNLYQAMSFADNDGVLASGENGLSVKLSEDNVINVKGTAEQDEVIVVGTYKLEAGKDYVFSSNVNGSKGTIYLRLTNVANGEEVKSCYNTTVVIDGDDISTDTTVKLEIVIAEDTTLNNLKIKPVLCLGAAEDDLVAFYK